MGIIKKIFERKNIEYYPFVPDELDLRHFFKAKEIEKMRALNVGIGTGHSALGRQLDFLKFKSLDLLDVHEPYIRAARMRQYSAKEVMFWKADIREFDTQDYDVVMMFDILEHLPKEDSLKVMKKIKCKQIIFIPLEQEYRKNIFEAKSQDHLSIWTEGDFIKEGYYTEVLRNFHEEQGVKFDALWALKK